MGKTRNLRYQGHKTFRNTKKIRNTKGTFDAKMSTIKDRNSMNLTETEDIKRWQEYTRRIIQKRS